MEGRNIGTKKDRIRCFEYDPLYGDNGIRTRDLCVANATLSQLSYVPATAVYYSAEKAETELIFSDFARPVRPSSQTMFIDPVNTRQMTFMTSSMSIGFAR